MIPVFRIFRLGSSLEQDRPQIDFELPENAKLDWDLINQVLDGRVSNENALPINIIVNSTEATKWDFFGIPGIFSQRAHDLLLPFATNHFAFCKLALNGIPYFIPKPTIPLDCLDKEKSVIIPYRHDRSRIKDVKVFHFKRDLIPEHVLFWIPELPSRILCTDAIRSLIHTRGFRGFRFDEIEVAAIYP